MPKATLTNTTINDGRTSAESLALAEALTVDTRRQIAALSLRDLRVSGLIGAMPCNRCAAQAEAAQ